jgi:FkbM family methyltransferase
MKSKEVQIMAEFPFDNKKNGWPWTRKKAEVPNSKNSKVFPRISIITPSFNQGQFLEETIRSVLLQGYPNLEYIIIDGGSTDNSLDVIKKYEPWLTYWVSEADRGQSHAINKGFKKATGTILAWLNADDIYLSGALFNIMDEYIKNGSEWIVGQTLITDINLQAVDYFIPQINTGKWKVNNYQSNGWLDFVMTHQSGTALPQVSSFWSMKALEDVGFVDESLKYAMDHDLYGKLARAGYRPKILQQTLACFRSHQLQKTNVFPIPFWKEEVISAKRWLEADLSPDESKVLNKYTSWFDRLIKWEQFIKKTGLKRFIFIGQTTNQKSKKMFQKIKRLIHGFFDNSKDQNIGIVSKEIIAKYIPSDPIILEAGAHIGLDTIELAKRFPKGRIFAFEPIPNLFEQLSKNTHSFNNVLCFPLALSDKVESAIMYVSGGLSDGSSSLLPPKDHLIDHPEVIFDKTINVNCVTLDDWAASNKITKIDLLWLDLQGNELDVLKAGLNILKNVQAVYTEVNLKEVYLGASLYSELKKWLESCDFKVEIEEIPWEDGGNVLFTRNNSIDENSNISQN